MGGGVGGGALSDWRKRIKKKLYRYKTECVTVIALVF